MADMDQVRADYEKFFKREPKTELEALQQAYNGPVQESPQSNQHPSPLTSLLTERRASYGPFGPQATIAQALKLTMRNTHNWPTLKAPQKEALEMIAHKIARILNGDPNLEDSWKDIAGYALRAIDPS